VRRRAQDLESSVGVAKATASRTFMSYLLPGLIGFGGAGSTDSAVGRIISAMVGGPLIVLSLRSLLNSPDPDGSPTRWIESINSMSPPRASGHGTALFPLQVNNLAIFIVCRTPGDYGG
jgi:hypothetical protein